MQFSVLTAAFIGFLLSGSLTVCTQSYQWVERRARPEFQLNATGFFTFLRDFREQAEMYAADNIKFASLIDRPWGEIDWNAVDEAIGELTEETRLFRDADDILIEMLAALWNSSAAHVQEHLGACGELTKFVLDIQARTRSYNTTEALHLYANDLRCNVELMKAVFWFNKSQEFNNDLEMLKAIIHTLTDLTRLGWVEMNMEWAAYMAFDVLPSEAGFYGQEKRGMNADSWGNGGDAWDVDTNWDADKRGMEDDDLALEAELRAIHEELRNRDNQRSRDTYDDWGQRSMDSHRSRDMDNDWGQSSTDSQGSRDMDDDWDVDDWGQRSMDSQGSRDMDDDWGQSSTDSQGSRDMDDDWGQSSTDSQGSRDMDDDWDVDDWGQRSMDSQRSRDMDEWDLDEDWGQNEWDLDEDWGQSQRGKDSEFDDDGTDTRNNDTTDEEDDEQLRLVLKRLLKKAVKRRYQSPRRK